MHQFRVGDLCYASAVGVCKGFAGHTSLKFVGFAFSMGVMLGEAWRDAHSVILLLIWTKGEILVEHRKASAESNMQKSFMTNALRMYIVPVHSYYGCVYTCACSPSLIEEDKEVHGLCKPCSTYVRMSTSALFADSPCFQAHGLA